jgi:hypothetical protein
VKEKQPGGECGEQRGDKSAWLQPSSTPWTVRFRLSPFSTRDRSIMQWLASIPVYHRAEEIRCALECYCRTVSTESRSGPQRHDITNSMRDSPPRRGEPSAVTKKLRQMF